MKPLRKCRDCGLEIFNEDNLYMFRTNSKMKHGKDNHCKKCHQESSRQYWKSESGRNTRLKRYGITTEDYNNMYKEQNGCCAICGIHTLDMKDEKAFLSVDHNHNTGLVRGLLCDSCNLGLGKFYDNIDNLKKAIEYLERSE